ncbi:hypothetical protein JTB14_020666 [Gonioctena quinquepunctata]|nr:hypothetical protein JTB14_020666 [Gonioctena quinquepunctata]
MDAGTQMAIEHCQNTFQWDRWNCPRTTFTRQQKLLPTKETAYSKALVAAAVVHVITRNCSRGVSETAVAIQVEAELYLAIRSTILERSQRSDGLESGELAGLVFRDVRPGEMIQWSWGGCSDDPSYAEHIAKKFLNSLDTGLDAAAYVARHNSKVGRGMIRNTMVRKCRCHGISGSCSLQTCWMQMSPFEDVSRQLKERYKNSERLSYQIVEKSIYIENSGGEMEEKTIPGIEHSLVYLDQSPDYCLTKSTEGFSGTRGRMCSKNANYTTLEEKNSCRNLCRRCGYSVKRMQKTVTKRCNCEFNWCCRVKCDSCLETVDEHFCV